MTNEMQKCVCHMPEVWSLEYIRSHWQSLEKESHISFFQSWYWIDAWLTVAKPFVRPIIFKKEGIIIGMVFVGIGTTTDYRFIKIPTIFPFATGQDDIDIVSSEYNMPLVIKGYEKIVKQALVHFLMTDSRFAKIPRLVFRRIIEEDLSDYHTELAQPDIFQTEISSLIPLEEIRKNDGFKDIISKNAHTQIKRSIKLYEEKYGKIVYEKPENATKAHNWFVELGKLNQLRFRSKGEKSSLDYPKLIRIHHALLDRYFEKGCVEVVRIRAGEKIIGYLYNFIFRKKVYFYMGGFVYEKDNKLKPGIITHYYSALAHAEAGEDYYDFMAGTQSYKKRLGQEGIALVNFTVTRDCPKYRLSCLLTKVRHFFYPKKNVPEPDIETEL